MKIRPSNQPKLKKAPLKVVLDREQRIVLDEISRAMTYPCAARLDLVRAATLHGGPQNPCPR